MIRSRLLGAGAFGCTLAALFFAAPVIGQGGTSLKGHNTDAPVDFAADRIEVQDRSNRVVFSGNVQANQGSLRLSASRVTVAYADGGGNGTQIRRMEASGGVTLNSPSETARSQFAIYDIPRRLVTMIGAVRLDQRGNHVQGGRLVLDLDSGRVVMDGGASGAPGQTGRVTGRFTVPRRTGG